MKYNKTPNLKNSRSMTFCQAPSATNIPEMKRSDFSYLPADSAGKSSGSSGLGARSSSCLENMDISNINQ